MKIKSINNIGEFEDKKAYIQYLLMNDDVSKIQETLDSLDNPLSVQEALENAEKILETDNKMSSILFSMSEEDKKEIVLNILLNSFINNNSFDKEVELFIRRKSSIIAWAKVETGMSIARFSHWTYRSEVEVNNNLLTA